MQLPFGTTVAKDFPVSRPKVADRVTEKKPKITTLALVVSDVSKNDCFGLVTFTKTWSRETLTKFPFIQLVILVFKLVDVLIAIFMRVYVRSEDALP